MTLCVLMAVKDVAKCVGSWRQALIAPRQINEHWPTFRSLSAVDERLAISHQLELVESDDAKDRRQAIGETPTVLLKCSLSTEARILRILSFQPLAP